MSCSEKLKGNQNQEKVRNKKDQHKRKTASPSESNITSKIQVLILITPELPATQLQKTE